MNAVSIVLVAIGLLGIGIVIFAVVNHYRDK